MSLSFQTIQRFMAARILTAGFVVGQRIQPIRITGKDQLSELVDLCFSRYVSKGDTSVSDKIITKG